jgi:prephenate dehydratase/chorismate mutase/prephenate dehydratase
LALKDIRNRIDLIDAKLLKLLNDRMEQVIMARKFKDQVEDSQREKEILDRIRNDDLGLIEADFCERLFVEIFRESKRLQAENYRIVGFQGDHGAYSEVACRGWDRQVVPVPCNEFSKVFDGVEQGLYDFGIVPVENTLGGVVGQVNDLILSTSLSVVAAVEMMVHHCLLVVPGVDHREIRTVYSHPQALAQCRHFLTRNKLEAVSYYDTAGSARMLAEQQPKGTAVIAGALAAELYNLEIIKENIEDLSNNNTRFLIFAREQSKTEGTKCSILFSTEHKAGTLFSVLEIFARLNINLSRIESIPKEPGNYAFFLDFLGSLADPDVKKALEDVGKITGELRLLGCYNEVKV